MKIITLTLSPAIDVTYAIPGEISLGLNRADKFTLTAGGKGINVARSIAREAKKYSAEVDCTALYPSGGAVGDLLTDALSREGIRALPVKTEACCRVNASAISADGRDIEINARGAEITADELLKIEAELDVLDEGDVLAICGSVPSGVEKSYYAQLIRRMKARGVICVLDCDGEAMRLAVCGDCPPDYVKPNEQELREFCKSIGAESSAEAIVKASGGRCTVIATYGGAGAALVRANGEKIDMISVKSVPVKPVRLKGAGDTLLGAYLYYRFVIGEAEIDALSAAVAAAGEYVSGV